MYIHKNMKKLFEFEINTNFICIVSTWDSHVAKIKYFMLSKRKSNRTFIFDFSSIFVYKILPYCIQGSVRNLSAGREMYTFLSVKSLLEHLEWCIMQICPWKYTSLKLQNIHIHLNLKSVNKYFDQKILAEDKWWWQ